MAIIGLDTVVFTAPDMAQARFFTDWVTDRGKPTNFKINRFSEWHLVDGIRQADDGVVRPSMAASGKQ